MIKKNYNIKIRHAMNDLIIKLFKSLTENQKCVNKPFSLTLNFEKVYEYYKHDDEEDIPRLNDKYLTEVKEVLTHWDVKNFNLTVEFENGMDVDENAPVYGIDWYDCKFIFHGEGKIEIVFDMLSNYCTLRSYDFTRFIGEDLSIKEENIPSIIQELVTLKNTLIENGNKVIDQLTKIKKSK